MEKLRGITEASKVSKTSNPPNSCSQHDTTIIRMKCNFVLMVVSSILPCLIHKITSLSKSILENSYMCIQVIWIDKLLAVIFHNRDFKKGEFYNDIFLNMYTARRNFKQTLKDLQYFFLQKCLKHSTTLHCVTLERN